MPGSLSLWDQLLRFDRGREARTSVTHHRSVVSPSCEIHQDAALCTEQGGKWVNLNQNFDNLLVAAALDRAIQPECDPLDWNGAILTKSHSTNRNWSNLSEIHNSASLGSSELWHPIWCDSKGTIALFEISTTEGVELTWVFSLFKKDSSIKHFQFFLISFPGFPIFIATSRQAGWMWCSQLLTAEGPTYNQGTENETKRRNKEHLKSLWDSMQFY